MKVTYKWLCSVSLIFLLFLFSARTFWGTIYWRYSNVLTKATETNPQVISVTPEANFDAVDMHLRSSSLTMNGITEVYEQWGDDKYVPCIPTYKATQIVTCSPGCYYEAQRGCVGNEAKYRFNGRTNALKFVAKLAKGLPSNAEARVMRSNTSSLPRLYCIMWTYPLRHANARYFMCVFNSSIFLKQ
jgi:hypothetical protein